MGIVLIHCPTVQFVSGCRNESYGWVVLLFLAFVGIGVNALVRCFLTCFCHLVPLIELSVGTRLPFVASRPCIGLGDMDLEEVQRLAK